MTYRLLTRRRLLAAGLRSATLLGSMPALPLAARAASANLAWQSLTTDLALVSGAGGNVLVISGPDGVALVDGGNEAAAEPLLSLVEAQTGGRPELLFNSHCHRDQIGCNQRLGAAGASIVAHENTRLWLGTVIRSTWENRSYQPLPAAALPGKTFYYDSETLHFNRPLTYGYLPQGHTDGDLYLQVADANVLFVGDVVSVGRYPLVDFATNGWIGGMINSLTQLLALCDAQTRVIAGSGGVVGRAHIEAQLELCSTVADRIGTHYFKGGSFEEFLASKPTAEFDQDWGDPSLFLLTAYQGTLPHVTEIRRFGRRQ